MTKTQILDTLGDLLTEDELADLVEMLSLVNKVAGGYGNIILDIKNGRLDNIEFGASRRPKLRKQRLEKQNI